MASYVFSVASSLQQRGAVTSITTPPKGKKTSNYVSVSGKPLLQKGDTVRVSSDYSPYKNSPGGDGIVTDVKGSGGKLTVDVQCDAIAAQKFEHDVPLFRLTRIRSATSSAPIIHNPPARAAIKRTRQDALGDDKDDGGTASSPPAKRQCRKDGEVRL